MSKISAFQGLNASQYARHKLHLTGADWSEKNCYVDVWIELLHSLQLNPLAVCPFTVAMDFEGDQWTFFKPPHEEIRALYGIDVQELTVWKPLLEHVVEHLAAGKLISTEADAFWLPDTSGTDYRHQHTKSTIIIAEIDPDHQQLAYFHNAGYFELDGEDFANLFGLAPLPGAVNLPLYAELIKIDSLARRSDRELKDLAGELLRTHRLRAPKSNPVRRFQQRFDRDLPVMRECGLAYYHTWAFATTRQLGAASELAAHTLKWISEGSRSGLDEAAEAFSIISTECKSFILRGARAVNSKKPFDAAATFDPLAEAWEKAMRALASASI